MPSNSEEKKRYGKNVSSVKASRQEQLFYQIIFINILNLATDG